MSIETMIQFAERRFDDCSAKYTSKALRKGILAGIENKALLNEVFGLTEDNLFTATMPLEVSEYDIRSAYLKTNQLITYVLNALYDGVHEYSLKSNTVSLRSGEMKLTRVLAKHQDFITKSNYFSKILEELSRDGSCSTKTFQDFICRLGELRNSNTSEIFITTSMAEFWGVNWNCAYRSCLRHKNETDTSYFTGTTAYGMDDFTMLIGVRRKADNYKLGRSWIHVFPAGRDSNMDQGGPFMVQVKSYGEFDSNTRKQVREWLQKKINLHYGIQGEWISCGTSITETHNHGYIDNYDLQLSYLKQNEKPNNIHLDFSDDIICLNCGYTTSDASEGSSLCDDCQDDYYCNCEDCGRHIHAEDDVFHSPDGESLCESCYNRTYFNCYDCSEMYNRDDSREVRVNGRTRLVCDRCACDNFTECSVCDTLFPNDEVHESVDGNDICDNCAEGYCDACGLQFEPDSESHDLADGRSFCTACRDYNLHQCSDCGEWFESSEDLNEDGLCEACVAKAESSGSSDVSELAEAA